MSHFDGINFTGFNKFYLQNIILKNLNFVSYFMYHKLSNLITTQIIAQEEIRNRQHTLIAVLSAEMWQVCDSSC